MSNDKKIIINDTRPVPNKNPIVIDHHALTKISDCAIRSFHETRYTPENSRDTQVFLILKGLHMFLVSQGIEPQFTVKPVKEECDTTPIDDL